MYNFSLGYYSRYAKVAKFKETIRAEQFDKESKRSRPCEDIDEVPWARGDDQDGWEEMSDTPLEAQRPLLPVVGIRVESTLWRFLTKLST